MSPGAAVAATAAALALLLSSADAADGAWAARGFGSSAAASGQLAAPTGTSITWDPVVQLRWTPSASTWATGQRVVRAVDPDGPYTQLGVDLPPTATTYDDPAGAGTFHYAVQAVAASWTSGLSPLATRADPRYVLTGSAPTTSATGCSTASSTSGMQQGFIPTGSGQSVTLGTTTFGFCTDAWTEGQSLPAGTTTMTAYVQNTHNKNACSVVVDVSVGSTSLGSATVTIPAKMTAVTAQTWSVTTEATSFTTGQRLTLTLAPQGRSCGNAVVHGASSTYPSSVTLTA